MLTRSKIRGSLAGIAIGDALGMPVEGWSKEEIWKKFPNGITKYECPRETGHKWFNGLRAGATTDDTQLTASVLKSIIAAGEFNMDSIARYHATAMDEDNNGWGRSTKEAIRRLANGVHWRESGKTSTALRGTGNGVPMKTLPLSLYYPLCVDRKGFNQKLVDFSAMTHYTSISAYAGIVHTHVVSGLLTNDDPATYSLEWDLIDLIRCVFSWENEDKEDQMYYNIGHLVDSQDSLELQMYRLSNMMVDAWDIDRVHEEFGNGSYYVLHSLPFSYAYFMRGYRSVDSLYAVASAGGDTDSNASMVGAMLGALNGMEIFEAKDHKHLLKNEGVEMLLGLADEFCRKFGL